MNTLLFYLKYSLIIFIIATTTACTGGGGDDTPTPTNPANPVPTTPTDPANPTPTDPANPTPTTPTNPPIPAPPPPPEPTTPTSPVGQQTIIDNTDIGFSTTGITWTTSTETTGFYGTDYSSAPSGTGASTATWKFTIDKAGYYVIFAQWTAGTDRASNAPYQILNNGTVVADIVVDQKLSGGKLVIIKSITLEIGTVEIVLTDKADGIVVADAIQLAYIISQPVATTPDGMTIDNGKPGYSTTGNWNNSKSTPGYYGDNYQSTVQAGTATWSFTVTTPGYYEVFANWTSFTNRETTAPYDIVSTSSSLNYQVIMDQTQNGGKFNSLGVIELVAGDLDITVTSFSTGKAVIADAVRICPYGSCSYQSIASPYKNQFFGKDSVTVDVNILNLQNGWGVEFILDGDEVASIKSYTPPFKLTYTALTKATHTVETYLINSNGSRLIKYYDSVTFDVGDSHVAFGDSTTLGVGDNQQSDNTSLDGRVKGGGYVPILNNKLTSLKGYPHFIVNKGFPGFKSSDGLLKIDAVLTENPDAQLFLILLGNNDSVAKVASGLGLTSGQAGYAGTYKDNMDKIITAIKAAGKTPYLAKIPYTTVLADNTLILDYNKVVDELVTLHSITLTPPDLYTYFEANQNQLADTKHPNGVGYQALADIWAKALTAP